MFSRTFGSSEVRGEIGKPMRKAWTGKSMDVNELSPSPIVTPASMPSSSGRGGDCAPAVAAASATLETYAEEGLFARAAMLEPAWETAIHSLKDAPHVIDIRNLGLMAGIDLAPRPGVPGARGAEIMQTCFDAGVLIRVTGDTIALSPPLIVSEDQIGEIVRAIRAALQGVV